MTSLEAGLEYAARGWKVMPVARLLASGMCSCGKSTELSGRPCMRNGKHPLTDHGHKDASSDTSQIEAWFERWPDANIAIATGAKSGLVVIDIDPKNGGTSSFQRLKENYDIPDDAMTVKTGGNGLHLYFDHPGFNLKGRIGMMAGIDVMADGGAVVAPPSIHKSGNRYEWAQPFYRSFPTILPERLLRRIQSK